MSWMSIGLFKPPLPHLPRLEMPFLSPYQQKTNDWRRSNRRSILIQRIHFLTQGREDCFPQMGQVVDHVCITLRVLNNWMKVIKTAGSILFPSYTLVPNLPSALRPHGNTYFVLNSYLYFGQRIDLFLYPVLLSGSCYHGSWYSFTVLRIFSTIRLPLHLFQFYPLRSTSLEIYNLKGDKRWSFIFEDHISHCYVSVSFAIVTKLTAH